MRYGAKLDGGGGITRALLDEWLPQVMATTEDEFGAERLHMLRSAKGAEFFTKLSKSTDFEELLTLPAFDLID